MAPGLLFSDRLCKYSYYSSFTGSVDLGRCLIFHESDTLSPDTTWVIPHCNDVNVTKIHFII